MERTWKADYEKFARTARENVAATLDNMDYPALERAAELILAAKAAGKRLHISGIGKPAHLAGYAACAGEAAQSTRPMPPIGKCKECVHWDEDDSQGFERLGNYVCICRKWSDHENGIRKYTGEGDCCKSFKRKKKELS